MARPREFWDSHGRSTREEIFIARLPHNLRLIYTLAVDKQFKIDPMTNDFISVQITASFVALCGAILTSIALIAIRKLQGVNFLVPVFYVGLSSVVLTTGAILASGSFQSVICGRWHEWFLLGLGLCGLGKCMETLSFLAKLYVPFK